MADRMLFIAWGTPIPGREEAAIETFNESVGYYGRVQQEGKIESFDVVLLDPNPELGGYIELHGSAQQLAALAENEEFRRLQAQVSLIVTDNRIINGVTNEGVAQEMAMYTDAVAKVPQRA
jgi:hypothetical protein